jgi:biopolymer transport protein ExbD
MGAKLGGGGGGRYTVQQNSDINVTPFVDIMLVLLIIFMVSIPPATVSIKLDMPPAHAPSAPTKPPVFVSVMPQGDIYVGPKKSSIDQLPGDVIQALNDPHPYEQTVLIRGDKDIQYDDFVKVLNTLQQHGFLKVSLITEDVD